jgi:hypothetical protein
MRHFLSLYIAKPRSGATFQSTSHSMVRATSCAKFRTRLVRNFCFTMLVCVVLLSSAFAQLPIPTSRADNSRTNANTNETLLTPSNVNKSGFGRIFSTPVDYVVMAQPLYMPNVTIPGQGVHNVVYVVTQADSVYAIDADTGAQLWYANMLNSVGPGATTASGKYLPCGTAPGFTQEGIVGTPVIDPNTNTMYLVAKSLLNGTVRHHLHALDITTGNEQANSPALITATSVSNKGHKTVFNSLHQKNRPGLLLLNGVLYLGFGSNYCNDGNSGWVLSYNPTSLSQLAVFNTSPDQGLTSIWQAGSGLAADEAGNIFVETAEAANNGYDIYQGGQTYCNSVVKLGPDLTVADYFTPWNVTTLNSNDFDLSSTGALVLPDQSGAYPHELIAGGKYGTAYVLDRDNMGMFSNTGTDSQIIQEITLVQQNPNNYRDALFGSPAYWNNTVYFAPNATPLMAFPVLPSGLLGTPVQTPGIYSGSHSPSISANGNTNGIMWVISSGLNAFDAVSLKLLYNTNQNATRDKLPPIGHFVTQTVANGKVYVATNNSLEAYGLFHAITVTAGGGQGAPVTTALATPIQINVANPYNGQPDVGAMVTFSDGNKGGSFNPASPTTDANGNVSTTYTVPQKAGTYTLTATLMVNGTASSSTTTTATATAGAATKLIPYGGNNQTGSNGFSLANPIVTQMQDAYKNPVPGVTVTFTANKGGVPNPSSVVTDASGMARTYLQLPGTPSTITVTATAPGPNGTTLKGTYMEHSVAGIATKIAVDVANGVNGGNNQFAVVGAQLPQTLTAIVTDQFGNPFSGNSVTFSDNGAGGIFSNGNPIVTGADGTATQTYTLPKVAGAVSINATAIGISSPAVFTETAVPGPAASIAIVSGNNQTAPNGTQLPQALVVVVTDQYGNPVSGVSVGFSDAGSGGTFSNPNPGATGTDGKISQFYTLPAVGGETVVITVNAAGVANSTFFTEYSQ